MTLDGGATWTTETSLKTTFCTGGTPANGGDYQRATDPWVTFGPTGIAYQLSLSFNDAVPPFTTFDFDHALLASRSTDGGLTWSNPVTVRRDTAPTRGRSRVRVPPCPRSNRRGDESRFRRKPRPIWPPETHGARARLSGDKRAVIGSGCPRDQSPDANVHLRLRVDYGHLRARAARI